MPRQPQAACAFLAAHPALDVLVLGEGEQTFLELLDAIRAGRPLTGVSGVVARDPDGTPRVAGPRARLKDLSSLASPYLDGTFDAFWSSLGRSERTALIETNRGCPFSCSFCDWGQATRSAVHDLPPDRVFAELEWVGERDVETVYLIDANFGIRRRDPSIIEQLCEVRRRTGAPRRVVFHLTKNARQRNLDTVERLRQAGIDARMSLSMQDMDAEVLRAIERENIPAALALELRSMCHERGIPTFNEIILGLPGQRLEGFRRTVVAATTPYPKDRFSLYLCRLLVNTEMASAEQRALHGLRTVRCPMVPADPNEHPVVEELEEIVVGSETLSTQDWRRAYCFGHLVGLFSQSGLIDDAYRQLVFATGLDAVAWLEHLAQAVDDPRLPALHPLGEVLRRYADGVIGGGPLLQPAPRWGERRLTVEEALVLAALPHREAVRSALQQTSERWVQAQGGEAAWVREAFSAGETSAPPDASPSAVTTF